MKNFNEKLLQAAYDFELQVKNAQVIQDMDTLVAGLKKSLSPAITQEAANFLNSRAVSSIPIRISYNKPNAEFLVNSVGSDSEQVNKELKSLLDKKYAAKVAQMLSKAKESSFEFGLLTVE